MLLNLSPSQTQSVLGQLEQALYNHEQWHKALLRTLLARLPADPPDMEQDAHRRCRFGQWCESPDAEPLRGHPTFVAMMQAHAMLHPLAAGLLQRSRDGLSISSADIDAFDGVLDRMRLEIQSLRRELSESLQNRDTLTGARNRVTMLGDLREQQALVRRGLQSCALAMFDLDHFKRVNDQYGHLAGDAVLAAASRCIQAQLRTYDRVYRYGGEEFLLCLPNTDLQTAAQMAERLRQAIAELSIEPSAGAPAIHVTVSIGVAMLDANLPVEQTIDYSDKAMYAAKAAGRNRVALWPDDVLTTTESSAA